MHYIIVAVTYTARVLHVSWRITAYRCIHRIYPSK